MHFSLARNCVNRYLHYNTTKLLKLTNELLVTCNNFEQYFNEKCKLQTARSLEGQSARRTPALSTLKAVPTLTEFNAFYCKNNCEMLLRHCCIAFLRYEDKR